MTISLGTSRPAPPQVLKIEAGYGRLYIGGPAAKRLLGLPGAAFNEKKGAVELSLTLEMLRAIRKETGRTKQEFAKFLTDEVLAWARKAGEHERKVNDLHKRISEGYRASLPWIDTSGQHRPAYDHQQVMATVATELDGCAFVCEMGCVDANTEYLSPTGWKRIVDYDGGLVGQYHPNTRFVEFVEPQEFVKLPCDEMIHFRSARGVDQMLSPEHRMLLEHRRTGETRVVEAQDLADDLQENRNYMRDWRLPTTFNAPNGKGLGLTPEQLRVQVAVIADGHFPPVKGEGKRCIVRLKRPRKIERLRRLLREAGIEAYERDVQPEGFVAFTFTAPIRVKIFDERFWECTTRERWIIADECVHWDGSYRKAGAVEFCSYKKESADFIQYCFATTHDKCASLNQCGSEYTVHASAGRSLKQLGNPDKNIERVPSPDGFKYCFRVPSTFLVFRRNGCIFPSGNTGKTRAAVESLSYLLKHDQLDLVLVVCPKGVLGTWRRELQTWAMGLQVTILDGPIKKRQKALADPSYHSLTGYPVFVTNYDVLYALEPVLADLAKQGQRIGVVFDEMHKLRNPETRQTRSAMKLSVYSAKWRLGLTGSPILQGAHDIWSQWYVLDLGMTFGANHKQFKREFFDENPYDFSIDAKDGTLEEIGQRMRRIGLRYTKQDCLDLPPKVYESIDVEMTKDQWRVYKEMEEHLIARLRGGDIEIDEDDLEEPMEEGRVATAITQVVMMMRLTTITSGFVKDENSEFYLFDPNPKLDALEEIVDENIGAQQIIVWARYRENVRAICERLARYHPVIIQGGQKDRERADAEDAFQSGRSRLLVANPAAGGVGLNLQAASLAIYYSQGYSLEHRIQSEDRCHRSGSEIHSKVTYIDLLASNTIDGVVAAALAGKKSVADMVTDLRKALGV